MRHTHAYITTLMSLNVIEYSITGSPFSGDRPGLEIIHCLKTFLQAVRQFWETFPVKSLKFRDVFCIDIISFNYVGINHGRMNWISTLFY